MKNQSIAKIELMNMPAAFGASYSVYTSYHWLIPLFKTALQQRLTKILRKRFVDGDISSAQVIGICVEWKSKSLVQNLRNITTNVIRKCS